MEQTNNNEDYDCIESSNFNNFQKKIYFTGNRNSLENEFAYQTSNLRHLQNQSMH